MNQTISPHFSHKNDYTMISLNVPNYLKTNFDNLLKFKKISRTSMLVNLMETYLRNELVQIKKDNELTKSFKEIKHKYDNPQKVTKEKPMIPYSNDKEMDEQFWNERLG